MTPKSLTITIEQAKAFSFREIIPALKSVGFSYNRQAMIAGVVSHQTIVNWKDGIGEPPYSHAIPLIAAYLIYCVPCETGKEISKEVAQGVN